MFFSRRKPSSTAEDDVLEGRQVVSEILKKYTIYDLLPISSKVIVFDTNLLVKKAFYALLQNGMSLLLFSAFIVLFEQRPKFSFARLSQGCLNSRYFS